MSLANLATVETDQKVEVSALLKQAVQELSGKANSAQVELAVSCGEAGVTGNPNLLYRAFYNLNENAIKYNREVGRVDITLSPGADHGIVFQAVSIRSNAAVFL